jgi:uncharacterized membrane protein YeaQ/YmgE (transglycosylase-associated protein family)
MLGAIIQVLISGFVIGALARWAVPGPDPMSVPMTILLGVFGSFIGGGIAAAIFGAQQDSGSVFATLLGAPGRQIGRTDDVDDQLRKLSELHRDGVLTDEEFKAKKAELLARS